MPVIMDVQGFKTNNNKLIVKEFGAYDGYHTCHVVFKPPFPFDCLPVEYRKQANWLMAHDHAIEWNAGFTQHFMFPQIIKHVARDATEVYVKGKEKADFIRKHIDNPVIELPETPALTKRPGSCFYHMNEICICALTYVYYLYENFVMT